MDIDDAIVSSDEMSISRRFSSDEMSISRRFKS